MKTIFTILIVFLFSSQLQAQFYHEQVINNTNRQALGQFAQRKQQQFMQEYERAVQLARQNGWPVRKVLEDGRVIQLVRVNDRGLPVYLVTHNATSAATISTDDVQGGAGTGYFLTGAGIEIGEWDGGEILIGHEQFAGRVTWADTSSPGLSDHSTHVCGTMIGNGTGDAAAKGMAPEATVKGYDFVGDIAEMSVEALSGMILSNHSYGFVAGWLEDGSDYHWFGDTTISIVESNYFGWYNSSASDFDTVAWLAPYYTIVASAGNDRNDSIDAPGDAHFHFFDTIVHTDVHPPDGNGGTGYDCLALSANAKNTLLVGAVEDLPGGYITSGMVSSAPFSSWGPTDDGRIKPDLVANGVVLKSASSSGPSAYSFKSGTSMSAPSVTGSIALLQQLYALKSGGELMRSATVKGLLIHTADEAGPAEGPDYMFGWGLMNTLSAAEIIAADSLNQEIIREDSILASDSVVYEFYSSGNQPITATLCWTDVPAGATPAGLDITTPKLVNDLDMTIYDPSRTSHLPYILDGASPSDPATTGDNDLDNVEKIYISMAGCGKYRLVIKHEGTLTGPYQHFSLILSGIEKSPSVAADAGIKSIDRVKTSCDSLLRPILTVKNYGADTLNLATIYFSLNGAIPDSFTYNGPLLPYCSEAIFLAPKHIAAAPAQEFKAWIGSPNGIKDSVPVNDTFTVSFDIIPLPDSVHAFPFFEDFTASFPPTDWVVLNPDAGITWDTLHTGTCPSKDTALYFNAYDYASPGAIDTILTPLIDLRMANDAILSFDVSHVMKPGGGPEILIIFISDNCGFEYIPQYFKPSPDLATAEPTIMKYIPPACTKWRRDTIDLNMFRGKIIRVAFVVVNGGGNSLFIDNVAVDGKVCPSETPVITPAGTFNFCGSAGLKMTASTAIPDHGFQWYQDGLPMVGAKDSSYFARDSGTYFFAHIGVCQYPVSAQDTITIYTPPVTGLGGKDDSGSCNSFSMDEPLTITDGAGGALATINDQGQDLGEVMVKTYDHGSETPLYNGEHYLERSFEITTAIGPGTAVDVTLYMSPVEYERLRDSSASINGLDDLMVTRFSSGTLGDPSSGYPTAITAVTVDSATGPGGAHAITFSTDSFSTFFIHSNDEMDALPVELQNFTVQWLTPGEEALLTWSTASEHNNSHFEIQRSTNLQTWKTIGNQAGQGSSTSITHYQFTDDQFKIQNLEFKILYYRLKQVDFNGKSAYSDVHYLSLKNNLKPAAISIFPNPATDNLTIQPQNLEEELQIILTDGTGRVLLTDLIVGITRITVAGLPEGLYYLLFESRFREVKREKVVVVR